MNIFSIMLSVNPISENSAEFQNSNFEIPSSIIWTRNFDLSCADLDVYDKFYACSKFQEMIEGPNKVSLRAFCGNHAVPVSTFRDWYRHYLVFRKTGEITMGRKCGRPPLIDEKGIEDLQKRICVRTNQQHTPDASDLNALLVDTINETSVRRGKAPSAESLSRPSKLKYQELANIEKGKVQHKSHARIVAEGDPRNALSMHALVVAFCQNLKAPMIGNFDATQFIVSNEGSDTGYFIKPERLDDTPLTAESNGGLDFAIKYYHVNNAAGYTSPPVFNIADPNMSEEDFIFYQIPGLGTNREQCNFGWLCFTKTRACNEKFYDWFAKTVLVPFVEESRKGHGGCKVK